MTHSYLENCSFPRSSAPLRRFPSRERHIPKTRYQRSCYEVYKVPLLVHSISGTLLLLLVLYFAIGPSSQGIARSVSAAQSHLWQKYAYTNRSERLGSQVKGMIGNYYIQSLSTVLCIYYCYTIQPARNELRTIHATTRCHARMDNICHLRRIKWNDKVICHRARRQVTRVICELAW